MNKRGQFYIIIALIISLALFGITYKVNEIKEPVLFSDFNDVSDNYISEATLVVNDALRDHEDVKNRVDTFTDNFLEYAKVRNPNIELIYLYSDGKTYTLVNRGVEETEIEGVSIPADQIIQGVTLEVGGNEFAHQVPVSAENFGDDWVSFNGESGPVELSIGGMFHRFRWGPEPDFRVLIRVPQDSLVAENEGDDSKDIGNVQQRTTIDENVR